MTQHEAPETADTALLSDAVGDAGPHSETEATVGRVFAEMLDLPGLPRTASLFDLGLDSVWVTVACARLEEITGVRVRFTQIFRTPTVAQLSAWIDAARDKTSPKQNTAAKPSAAEGDQLVAITPMQSETVPQQIVVEIAWWFPGKLDEAALKSAATDVHRRHQALHSRYLSGPDLGLAEVPADPGQVEFHHLGEEDTDKAAIAALRRVLQLPLKVEEGAVWRCAVVRSGESWRTLYGLSVDHSGFDGRSWDILTAELAVAYTARVAGKEPQWPGRTASLAEIACDFRHQLAAADIEAQRRYWREELHELPPVKLPARTDGEPYVPPVPDGSRFSVPGPATWRYLKVEPSQLRPWDEYARANGMPASVCVAAVYVESLIRAGAPRDFAVMVPIANNSGELIDNTITNRVGNILLRPYGPSRSGPHVLARVRGSYQHAMAARDVLVDPRELGGVLNGASGVLELDRLVALNYNSDPNLSLAGLAGTILSEGSVLGTQNHFAVMLIAVPSPEALEMIVQVRTDMHDANLADHIKQHFLDIISEGPERLEQRTAWSGDDRAVPIVSDAPERPERPERETARPGDDCAVPAWTVG